MNNFLFLVLGVGLLTVGGEALIRGSLAAARRLGVSPLLSGLIIVGFGTSMPELVMSVDAALNQQPEKEHLDMLRIYPVTATQSAAS